MQMNQSWDKPGFQPGGRLIPLKLLGQPKGSPWGYRAKHIVNRLKFPAGGRYEDAVDSLVADGVCASHPGAGSAAAGRPGSALHDGVLLQDAMGASAGVLAAFSEEPFSAAAQDSGKRAHCRFEDRNARQSHD